MNWPDHDNQINAAAELRRLHEENERLTAAIPAPTVESESQDWRGMDGTTAYWLIQRHADGWADVGKMMGEWLAANTPDAARIAHLRQALGEDGGGDLT